MRIASLTFLSAALLPIVFGAPATSGQTELAEKRDSESSALTTWCTRFNNACLSTCLTGAAPGPQNVTYACTSDASATNYKFGCKCNTVDKTAQVLTSLGGLSTSTRYTSTSTSHYKTTTRTTTTPTVTQMSTTIKTIDNTITGTTSVTETDSATTTQSFSTTTTSTSVLPTTYTSTHVSTVLYTSQVTVTQTSASVLGQPLATTLPFNVIEVSLAHSPAASKRRAANTDVFCQNYSDSCARQCGQYKSKVKTNICQRTSTTLYSYRLGCFCNNGYTETKHALAALEGSVNILSTLSVSTSSATVTLTSVAPVTTVETVTGTSLRTFYTTGTSSFTITNTLTIDTTSTSTSVPTSSPTASTTTTTSIPVATHTATSTVLTVLAPTGVIGVRKVKDDSLYGYLTEGVSGVLQFTATADTGKNYMLVADNSGSGLYKLQRTDTSAASIVCELQDNSNLNLALGSNRFCVVEDYASQATQAGPANAGDMGSYEAAPYETYWLQPYISTVANKIAVKIFGQWINQDGSRPTTYLVPDTSSSINGIIAVADIAAAEKLDNNIVNSPLYLALGA